MHLQGILLRGLRALSCSAHSIHGNLAISAAIALRRALIAMRSPCWRIPPLRVEAPGVYRLRPNKVLTYRARAPLLKRTIHKARAQPDSATEVQFNELAASACVQVQMRGRP